MRLMFGLLTLCILALGGCNSYNLRYQAIPQPKNVHLFADYALLQDAVAFSVDTDGNRLEDIYVKKTDGTVVRPVNIAPAGYYQSAALGTGVGVGAGHVGVGTGIGIPIGPRRAHGLSNATFALGALGAAPWDLHVKVHGVEEAVVPGMGGKPTAK